MGRQLDAASDRLLTVAISVVGIGALVSAFREPGALRIGGALLVLASACLMAQNDRTGSIGQRFRVMLAVTIAFVGGVVMVALS